MAPLPSDATDPTGGAEGYDPLQRFGQMGLTFDDGHVSNLKAVDALAQRDFTAEFFVNPATVGTQGHLGWAELREMAAAGMSIQSHGFHHRYLDMLSPQDVMTELVDSRREIEDRLLTD